MSGDKNREKIGEKRLKKEEIKWRKEVEKRGREKRYNFK